MDILGIGTDIVECPRIGKMIEQHGELFLRRVYTEREIRYCQARKHAIEHFAGRWAAKEAILKAMGTGRSRGVAWTHLEVRNGQDGQPASWSAARRGRWRASGASARSWSRSRTAGPMPRPMRWPLGRPAAAGKAGWTGHGGLSGPPALRLASGRIRGKSEATS